MQLWAILGVVSRIVCFFLEEIFFQSKLEVNCKKSSIFGAKILTCVFGVFMIKIEIVRIEEVQH